MIADGWTGDALKSKLDIDSEFDTLRMFVFVTRIRDLENRSVIADQSLAPRMRLLMPAY